ncbi:unnamed protein product, partial [Rotaria sp. Silwood2]
MTSSLVNGHHTEMIDNNHDESEYDWEEYYFKDKTMALRGIYIP